MEVGTEAESGSHCHFDYYRGTFGLTRDQTRSVCCRDLRCRGATFAAGSDLLRRRQSREIGGILSSPVSDNCRHHRAGSPSNRYQREGQRKDEDGGGPRLIASPRAQFRQDRRPDQK